VYCVLYLLSCVTKHANHYWVLMLGRVLGGIATSLLFSSFESWMVCEHNARGYDAAAMGDTFSLMYFGNSLCAILAGMMAEAAADSVALTKVSPTGFWHYGGYCSPFDLSALFLTIGFVLITTLWGENYGSSSGEGSACDVGGISKLVTKDPSILLAGAVISLFEGSMYIFVFNWTPALSTKSAAPPPFGLIFAAFMVACMGGSSLFAILSRTMSAETLLKYVFLASSLALALPLLASTTLAVLVSFLAFEACVGMYWPCIGTVKSQVVPEESRATIYNVYRVPLNAIVLGVLLNHISTATALTCCSGMLLMAFVCQRSLVGRMSAASKTIDNSMSDEEGAPNKGLMRDY